MKSVDISKLHQLMYTYDEYKQSLYLSYPVESNWNRDIDEEMIKKLFSGLNAANLYMHFPFCESICYYCCCENVYCISEQQKEDYIQLIKKEFEYKLGERGIITIQNMHLGGGTPTIMTVDQLTNLLHIVNKFVSFKDGGIKNIEVFPDKKYVTKEKLSFLRTNGFNHISLGIQDLNARVLETIHRKSDITEIEDIIYMARDVGFKISIDLCYGLPYQGLSEFEYTINKVLELKPDRIVIYPYSHFPHINVLQRKIPDLSIPNNFIKTLIKKNANEILEPYYQKFGNDTYLRRDTKEGDIWGKSDLVHGFMGTEADNGASLLGIGVSAISKIDNTYIKNQSDLRQYTDSLLMKKTPIEKMKAMTIDEQIRHDVIEKHILIHMNINKAIIENHYNIVFDQYFEQELARLRDLQQDGIVENVDSSIIGITEYGQYLLKYISRIFDKYN